MLSASLYIILCTARNRVRTRLRRLREPRYLIGAIVGSAYVYVSFFARYRVGRRVDASRPPRQLLMPPVLRTAGPALGGTLLMAFAAVAWLLPFDSGLLDFSDAEVQFLFPAPVPRRQLLLHRLLRSQLGMLFGSIVIGLFAGGITLTGFVRLRIAIGSWLLLLALKLYFTGVTLARTRLLASDNRSRRVAWVPIVVFATALTAVGAAVARQYMSAPSVRLAGLAAFGQVSVSGPSAVALWPFAAIVAPLFAPWPGPYLVSLGWAALIVVALGGWVIASDGVFQEAAADVASRRGEQKAGVNTARYKVRPGARRLAARGRPELAFAWKGSMQTLRTVDKRSVFRLVAILFATGAASISIGRSNSVATIIGAFSLLATAFAVILAPQAIRSDMREDLAHLALLRTWPIKASAVVRGEILWPGALITIGAWTTLTLAVLLSGTTLGDISLAQRMAGGSAIAILAPAVVFAQLTILNALALMFPAWVPLGAQRARGLDAMGQRLITMGGTWLLLVIALLPGVIVGGIVWFALSFLIGPAAMVPAATVCTAIVAIEVLLATEALGPAYERLDVTSVEKAE